MTRFSNLVTVTAKATVESETSKFHPNKNGIMPIWLEVLNGKAPNRNVLDGTIAAREGFEAGKTYLAKVQEGEPDEQFGRQFTWTKIKELEFMEIMQATAMGNAEIFKVEETNNSTEGVVSSEFTAQEPAL